MVSKYTKDHKGNVYGFQPNGDPKFPWRIVLGALAFLTLLFFGFYAMSATVVTSGFAGPLSETRAFERSGPYHSQWTDIPSGANSAYHQGRTANVFEDAGKGQITFKVIADEFGRARVAFQDVGDTRNFGSFAINGETVDLPSQRSNSGWITADLDFGVGGLGWHEVKATTALRPGLSNRRQDGFGACKSRKR